MHPPHGAGETSIGEGEAPLAPVISLAGARAARRGEPDDAAADGGPGRDGPPPAAENAPASPALTVIEHRRPTADELRALAEQVRQVESAGSEERGDASPGEPASLRAARRAENVALHAITRRGQSRAEVAERLARRDLPPDIIEAELARLAGVGLIDDHALARDLVDRLRTRKKLGAGALQAELQRRRLDRGAIEEALAAAVDDEGDSELVDELARDRARRLGGLDRATAERRLVDYLARKGHGGSRAREAARRALDGTGSRGGGRPVEFQ